MSSGWHRWSLGSLLLLLGKNLGIIIDVHQDSVSGTVGQSVLLPVSYMFRGSPHFPVWIRWDFSDTQDTIVTCSVRNCSLDAGGAPSNCSASDFIHKKYHSRAGFFPENGSLLLRDLRLSDSGVYSITFILLHQTRHITLSVHEQRLPPQHPDAVAQGHVPYYIIGICSSVSLLLLLLCCFLRHWGAARQQQRRTVQQQQVSSVEEVHVEGAVVRDTTTVYARIGESFELTSPRAAPGAVYSSVTPPGRQGLDTGLYHLLA